MIFDVLDVLSLPFNSRAWLSRLSDSSDSLETEKNIGPFIILHKKPKMNTQRVHDLGIYEY